MESQGLPMRGEAKAARAKISASPRINRASLRDKVAYVYRVLPALAWQRIVRRASRGRVHLIIALADHFEPSIVPEDGLLHAPYDEQERRLEFWCRECPRLADRWRDADGRPFVHTYFYPAEQNDRGLIERLAELCRLGWGEIEIQLHHGIPVPDNAENTCKRLLEFRDALATDHGCLSYFDGAGSPRYGFVHGNFALANSADGRFCGVDDEMQLLADTGCYGDFTLPSAPFHPAQTAKINSIHECALPLTQRAPHRSGRNLKRGTPARVFPLIVQGPLALRFSAAQAARVENGAITRRNPLSLSRLGLWKQAAISVHGKPDWLFIKLHCHGMDPTQQEAVIGLPMREFLRELVEGADQRSEILHFVSTREMVNIVLAACDGREGSPGDYRDYRLQRRRTANAESSASDAQIVVNQ